MEFHLSSSWTIVTLAFLLSSLVKTAASIGVCYTPGPAFPVPSLSASFFASSRIPSKLDALIASVLIPGPSSWSSANTSFAIQLTSGTETLWSSYYTAPVLGDYEDGPATPVTGDTVFRIASISKSFTVYALLLEAGIRLDDAITKYLPELNEGDDEAQVVPLDWDNITVRSLASQLSGLGRGNGNAELSMDSTDLPDPVALGFPFIAANETKLKPCMKNDTDRPCTADEIIKIARQQPPIFSPNDRSTYSNIAYSLLGLALENVTGSTFSEVISSSIIKPLGMENTTTIKPNDSNGIIPSGPTHWRWELGSDIPSGGVYTTVNDLSKYLRSILKSTLLPKAVVNDWMKPHSWTSSGSQSAYGMPWEILRTSKLTPDGRPIDIITKGGSLNGYYSSIVLIPEFGLGLTILVAGAQEAQFDLRERVIATLVPEIDKLVRAKVQSTHAGFYGTWNEWFSPLNTSWSVVLEVDDGGPGLRVSSWISNSTDFLPTYGWLKGMPQDQSKWEARLLPTNFDRGDGVEAWRVTAIPKREEANESKVFNDYCFTDVDGLMYGGWSIEEFLFELVMDETEPAVSCLRLSGMRTLLFKDNDDSYMAGNSEQRRLSMENKLKQQIRSEDIHWTNYNSGWQ